MHRELVRLGLGASMLVGLGLSGTQAAAIRSLPPEALGVGSGPRLQPCAATDVSTGAATSQARRACARSAGSTSADPLGAGVAPMGSAARMDAKTTASAARIGVKGIGSATRTEMNGTEAATEVAALTRTATRERAGAGRHPMRVAVDTAAVRATPTRRNRSNRLLGRVGPRVNFSHALAQPPGL